MEFITISDMGITAQSGYGKDVIKSMKKTKIICTMGPATEQHDILADMMKAGMNVCRLNFSHGSHEEHGERIKLIKEVREELNMPVALLLDTKGPEVRIKTFKEGRIQLTTGNHFTLTTRELEGDESIVSITYAGLPTDVKVGTSILIDDGLIGMVVEEVIDGTDIVCRVLNDGGLSNRKSLNVPEINLSMEYMSPKDKSDIEYGLTQDIDFIAASFVRSAADVMDIRAILKDKGCEKVQIIAKIENMEGFNNLEEILDVADGVMVARGDLGVEVSYYELPRLQKHMIKTAISRGKIVVTATQMLESMAKNPRATRAEVSDVANAVYDGTTAIMLSGETATGKYPVETVRTMATIAENTEKEIHYDRRRITRPEFTEMELAGSKKTRAIAHATCATSFDLGAKCIVALTDSGETARAVSAFRPATTIVGGTPNRKTYYQMALRWGVIPVMVTRPETGTQLYTEAARAAVLAAGATDGDIITVTAGMPVGRAPYTNTMRLLDITQTHVEAAYEENE